MRPCRVLRKEEESQEPTLCDSQSNHQKPMAHAGQAGVEEEAGGEGETDEEEDSGSGM